MENVIEGLDAEQRAVVAHDSGHAIVIAGPGAGKTRTLTARAAALLMRGVAPESIMMLTFTRASAKEMVSRARGIDQRAEFATAGTFHAIASRIISDNLAIFGRSPDAPFVVLDREDEEQLIKMAMEPIRNGAKNWPRATTIAKIISYSVNARTTILEALRRKSPDYEEHADDIARIAEAYAAAKIENGQISYDDCLVYLAALLEDPEIGSALCRRYRYVLVDEAQDSNALQLMILKGLSAGGAEVMVVGDSAQSIYGFRGAGTGVLAEFQRLNPDAKVYLLTSNYRSTAEIIALTGAIDGAIDTGFPRVLRSATGRRGERPTIVDVHDSAAEASAIADAILADKAAGGEICNHAVLVRSTASARRIEAEFITRSIPFTVQGGTRIDEAAHIRDLLSVARLTINVMHQPAWLRVLLRFPRIGDKAAGDIAEIAMRSFTPEGAAETIREQGRVKRANLDALADALVDGAREGSPAIQLERIIARMEPIWSEVWKDDWKQRVRDLEAVIAIAQEHPRMDQFLTAITLDGSLDREGVVMTQKPDEKPAMISTIHSSKGLEFDNVHIPQFIQGGMPSMFANGPDERSEELRIAFVAMTRARTKLTLYRPRVNGQNNATMLSDFDRLVAPHADHDKTVRQAKTASATIETTKRIDMRSKLLGGFR